MNTTGNLRGNGLWRGVNKQKERELPPCVSKITHWVVKIRNKTKSV
jgi:hypothetical protein